MKKIIACFAFSLAINKVQAQSSIPDSLENVTVTASLLQQQQKETGRNITIIKGDYFNQLPVHSVDELLRYLPGIEVQQRGPQGSQSDIVIRGGTFQQVLVVIDGVKLNDPLTGHFNSYIPIHPAEIERIEILKGAASAIYGSEAVGGVINVITKTFAEKIIKKKNGKANITVGQNKLVNGGAHLSLSTNSTAIAAGVLTNNADGEQLRGTTSFFHLTTASLAISRQLKNNWRISLRGAIDARKFNAQNYYTTFASDTANETVKSGWIQLNINKKTGKGFFNGDITYKKLRDQFWFRPAAIPNDNKTNLFLSQLYYTNEVSKKFSYTTGLQLQRKEIISNDRGNHQLWHGAGYIVLRQKLKNHFYLNESIRLDWDESYGISLLPQINLAWSPSKITLRASAGKSIRDADFTERYNNYNKTLVTSGSIGNPDLQAEKAWNFEVGADYQLTNLKISSTFFYRNQDNLVDWAPTAYANMPRKVNLSPTGSYSLAKNVANVNTTGLELDMAYHKKISNKSLLFFMLGYTWLQSKNDDSIPSFYISSHAKHLANISAIYSVNKFSVAINGLYKKRDEKKAAAINAAITPSYFIAGIKLAYSLPKKYGKIYFQADNIFNKKYSDLLGSKMPGRWLSGGFEIAL
jgi:vitamin B12 transporter